MWLRSSLFVLAMSLLVLGGCAKSFNVAAPVPSGVEYSDPAGESYAFEVKDVRSPADSQFSTGDITANLDVVDEIAFLKTHLKKELKMRGVNVVADGAAQHRFDIEIRKYRIRNHFVTGFAPYVTFMTFSADLHDGDQKHRITSYFKTGKMIIWAFREVEQPCYNIPISLMVREVASKINRRVMKLVASDAEVERLNREIQADSDSDYVYQKVLELGYTNNPKAVAHLVNLAKKHDDSMVRACAVSGLGMLQAAGQLPFLIEFYREHENTQKFMALKAIGDMDIAESWAFMDSVRNSDEYHKEEMIREVVDLYY